MDEARRRQRDRFKAMTPAERWQAARDLYWSARRLEASFLPAPSSRQRRRGDRHAEDPGPATVGSSKPDPEAGPRQQVGVGLSVQKLAKGT